jgi:hypothetical protein
LTITGKNLTQGDKEKMYIAISAVVLMFAFYTYLVVYNIKNKPHRRKFKKPRYRNIENIVARSLKDKKNEK